MHSLILRSGTLCTQEITVVPPTIVPMNDLKSGFQLHFATRSRTYSAALLAPSGIRKKMIVVAPFVLELFVFQLLPFLFF